MKKGNKMFKLFFAGMLAAALAVSTAACGSPKNGGDALKSAANTPGSNSETTVNQKLTQYPITVKDAAGKDITFNKAPDRIVSLSPSTTEILFALGLDDKIVGVSNYCDFPEQAKSKPKMGDLLQGNTEAIVAADPEVIIGGLSVNKKIIAQLGNLNKQVFTVEPKKIDDVIDNILLIGKITNKQAQAEQVVAKMNAERNKVTDAVKNLKPDQKKKVYIEFSPGWTVGKGEFMDEMISVSAGTNIASDVEGWKKINEEKVIQDNPDVILFAKGIVDDKTNQPVDLEKMIRTRSGWDKITAVKDNRIAGIDQNIISRPGPRITEGLAEMAKAIYPELVK